MTDQEAYQQGLPAMLPKDPVSKRVYIYRVPQTVHLMIVVVV